jgi:hypothetical protein
MTGIPAQAATELEYALATQLGETRAIRRIRRTPSAQRSSFPVQDLDVDFEDGTTLELVVKTAAWEALLPEGRRAKPPFLWDPHRERVTYESILPAAAVGSARYYGAYEDSAGAVHLLFERVAGSPLWQFGELEAWREAARWLADLHVCRVEDVVDVRTAAHLLRYDRPFYDRWLDRALAFHGPDDAGLAMLATRHPRAVERLLAERPAFIHGEFYAANVLVDRGDDATSFAVYPVDWEMAALGPALMDLACLAAGQWTDDERADLADSYLARLAARGGTVPPRPHALETLDYCLIHLSVRNLGWSGDWVPPASRTHDWLGEALRLCRKWDL